LAAYFAAARYRIGAARSTAGLDFGYKNDYNDILTIASEEVGWKHCIMVLVLKGQQVSLVKISRDNT